MWTSFQRPRRTSGSEASRDLKREPRQIKREAGERLNQHPELKTRIEAILELAESKEGELRTADEIEEVLILELRRLGGETIWRDAHKSYIRVFAGRIGVGNRGRSRALERVLTDFGIEHSFAKANFRLKEHYGFELNAGAGANGKNLQGKFSQSARTGSRVDRDPEPGDFWRAGPFPFGFLPRQRISRRRFRNVSPIWNLPAPPIRTPRCAPPGATWATGSINSTTLGPCDGAREGLK